jgi:cytochrome c oxidase subunit 3
MYPDAWKAGSHHQNWMIGAGTTIVLIGSSLTMALAVWGAQQAKRKFTTLMLVLTLILGGIFVGVKGYEYAEHIHEGLFPGSAFTYVQHDNPHLTKGVELFMTFYFTMTGLHALHMIIGAGLLLYFIRRTWRGDWGPEYYSPIEIMGLYWHFVDIVWIFLFPLLYLV